MFITRTPYRLSLYGGGLDYQSWFSNKNTRILCAGLDYYCYLTVRELPPFFDHNYKISYSKIETAKDLNTISHPTAREVIRKYGNGRKIEVSHVGDLPAKSGIGSSSAFTVGLISSLNALSQNKILSENDLAKMAIDIEQNHIGETIGVQDQCASAYGGFVQINAGQKDIEIKRISVNSDYQEYIESSLLMGFTGKQRFSSIASKKIDKALRTSKNADKLQELHEISQKGIDSILKESDIFENARLTKLCRDIKLSLNGDIENKEITDLIEATENAGSLCTRIMGAGGGGFFVCWAPPEKHNEIKQSVKVKTWVKVKISEVGSQIIHAKK